MNTVINAFHPDYIKTYHPNFGVGSGCVGKGQTLKNVMLCPCNLFFHLRFFS